MRRPTTPIPNTLQPRSRHRPPPHLLPLQRPRPHPRVERLDARRARPLHGDDPRRPRRHALGALRATHPRHALRRLLPRHDLRAGTRRRSGGGRARRQRRCRPARAALDPNHSIVETDLLAAHGRWNAKPLPTDDLTAHILAFVLCNDPARRANGTPGTTRTCRERARRRRAGGLEVDACAADGRDARGSRDALRRRADRGSTRPSKVRGCHPADHRPAPHLRADAHVPRAERPKRSFGPEPGPA